MRRYSEMKIIALYSILNMCFILPGCRYESHSYIYTNNSGNPVTLQISLQDDDLKTLPETAGPIERNWVRYNKWDSQNTPYFIDLSFILENSENSVKWKYIRIAKDVVDSNWPESESYGEPVNMVFENDLGKVTFNGRIGSGDYEKDVTAFGKVLIEYNEEVVKKVEKEFDQKLSLDALVSIVMINIEAEPLIEYASCGVKLNIKQAVQLSSHDYNAKTVRLLVDNGLKYDAEELINLASHNISANFIIDWKKSGYDLSVKDLIYAQQRNINAQYAAQWQQAGMELNLENLYWAMQRNLQANQYPLWKNAGYDLSLEQLYWVNQRNINPRQAAEWNDAGYELSIEQLFWASQRNLNPRDAASWKKAGFEISLENLFWANQRNIHSDDHSAWKDSGYELSLEQLYWAKQRNVNPNEAAEWKNAGYNFSIEDLYELKQHNIGSSYGASLADPSYEPLTAKQLIELKQSNMSAETINNLRKSKDL
jgi:hypothetical protein